jgi:hypothetical protein
MDPAVTNGYVRVLKLSRFINDDGSCHRRRFGYTICVLLFLFFNPLNVSRSIEIYGFHRFRFIFIVVLLFVSIFLIDSILTMIFLSLSRIDVGPFGLKESWMLVVVYCKRLLVRESARVDDRFIRQYLDRDWYLQTFICSWLVIVC